MFRLKREDIRSMFPICIPNDFLNMCSEPFVVALNVRSAWGPFIYQKDPKYRKDPEIPERPVNGSIHARVSGGRGVLF